MIHFYLIKCLNESISLQVVANQGSNTNAVATVVPGATVAPGVITEAAHGASAAPVVAAPEVITEAASRASAAPSAATGSGVFWGLPIVSQPRRIQLEYDARQYFELQDKHTREIDARAVAWLTQEAVVTSMKRIEEKIMTGLPGVKLHSNIPVASRWTHQDVTGVFCETPSMLFSRTKVCTINFRRWKLSVKCLTPTIMLRDPVHSCEHHVRQDGSVVSLRTEEHPILMTHMEGMCDHWTTLQYITVSDDMQFVGKGVPVRLFDPSKDNFRAILPLENKVMRRLDQRVIDKLQCVSGRTRIIKEMQELEQIAIDHLCKDEQMNRMFVNTPTTPSTSSFIATTSSSTSPSSSSSTSNAIVTIAATATSARFNHVFVTELYQKRSVQETRINPDIIGACALAGHSGHMCLNFERRWTLCEYKGEECFGLQIYRDTEPFGYVNLRTDHKVVTGNKQPLVANMCRHGCGCPHGRVTSDHCIDLSGREVPKTQHRSQEYREFMKCVDEARQRKQPISHLINWQLSL